MRFVAFVMLAITLSCLLVGSSAEAKKSKPKDMTCEAFLALDPDVQQRVVWYTVGWQRAGVHGESIIEEDFDVDIAVIVAECKKTPKESVWKKVKKHF